MIGHDLRQSLQVIQSTYALLRARPQDTLWQTWVSRGEREVVELIEQFNCFVDAFCLAEQANVLEFVPIGLGPIFSQLQRENREVWARKRG